MKGDLFYLICNLSFSICSNRIFGNQISYPVLGAEQPLKHVLETIVGKAPANQNCVSYFSFLYYLLFFVIFVIFDKKM